MDSSCWKMISVREQFCTHWPERIVRRKEVDVVSSPAPDAYMRVVDSFSFLTAIFAPGEFQWKVREVDQRQPHSTVRVNSEHGS